MFNPMISWNPGMLVDYRGSLTTLHGAYAAHPCGCCKHADERTNVRLQLLSADGTVVVSCVRPASVTPRP